MRGRIAGMLLGAAVLAAAGWGAARAEEAPAIDPQAKDALVKCGQYLQALQSFRVQVATTLKMEAEGMRQEFAMATDLAVQRTNRLAMVYKGGMLGGSIVCDGATVYTYVPALRQYMARPAPARLSDLAADVAVGGGSSFPLAAALIADKPEEAFLSGVVKAAYVGTEVLEGQPCHHVRLEQEQFSWDAWILTGDRPLLVRVVPDVAAALRTTMASAREGEPGLKDMKAEMTITLSNWKTSPDLPAELFTFTPPPDARKVDTFFGESMDQFEAAHPLQGQPAPAFKLPLLGEGELSLAGLKGKNTVILDFWATWCGPCRLAMPVLAEVAAAFKERGVVLYAVNLRDEDQAVRDFVASLPLPVTVAMDRDGRVGQLYMVEGIPQSVIIGKDGLVKKVHMGFLPDMKAVVAQELEEILAADSPAPAPVPPAEAGKPAEPVPADKPAEPAKP